MKIRPTEVIVHQPPTLTTLSPGCTWLTALFALGAMVGSGALFIAQRAQLRVQEGELAIAQEGRREQEEDRRKTRAASSRPGLTE